MNRLPFSALGIVLAWAIALLGCSAQQAPFKFHSDGDLAHYNDVATKIEYPNIADCPSDAAITCPAPEVIGPDSQPTYWDMKLEETIQIGLAKSKVLHDLGGTVLRSPPNTRTIADPSIIDTDPRYGVEAALSAFDATFNSRFDYQFNHRFVNNVFFGGGTRELMQDTDIFHSDVTKTAATGGTFTFGHNMVYDHNNSPGNLFGSAWDTNFEGSIRQPFLQGAGVEYNRIAGPKATPGNLNGVLLARVNTDISLADFEIGLRDMVSNIENAYWDLYFAYRNLDAKIAARDLALESWRNIHAQFAAGRRGAEAQKEAEAREQYFRFQQEVQDAWAGRLLEPTETNNGSPGGTFHATGGVRVCERRLRFLIGLPASDGRLIRPADEPSLAKVVFCWDDILPEAINRRAELRRQRWAIKRDELALIASRNFLLPKLDSFALYRIRGFGRDLKDGMDNTPENSAFADLASTQHQEWEFGMEFSMPLGERQGHAAVRNAQLLLSRDRALLDDQERAVVLDVSNAMAEIDRAYETAQTAYNRRLAAKINLAASRAAYEHRPFSGQLQPEAPLDLYLEAQRRDAEAETDFFAALSEYALAIKNLHFVKGSLLDYNEIYLAEGPWPGKAYKDAASRISRWHSQDLNYIIKQPPPISQGTEPHYQLPPPVEPLPGPPPAPSEMPRKPPEELPNTIPLPPTGPPPTSDKRFEPPSADLRAAVPNPPVRSPSGPEPARVIRPEISSAPPTAGAGIRPPASDISIRTTPASTATEPPKPPAIDRWPIPAAPPQTSLRPIEAESQRQASAFRPLPSNPNGSQVQAGEASPRESVFVSSARRPQESTMTILPTDAARSDSAPPVASPAAVADDSRSRPIVVDGHRAVVVQASNYTGSLPDVPHSLMPAQAPAPSTLRYVAPVSPVDPSQHTPTTSTLQFLPPPGQPQPLPATTWPPDRPTP
jgi:outer membrane protein TolC